MKSTESSTNPELGRRTMLAETPPAVLFALLDTLSDAVVVIKRSGEVIFANRATMRLADLLGLRGCDTPSAKQALHEILHPDGTPMSAEDRPFSRLLKGHSFHNCDCTIVAADGSRIEMLITGGWVDTAMGKHGYVVGKDITSLREAYRIRDEFIEVASHELRNPLQVLSALVRLLDTKMPEAARQTTQRYVESLHEQVGHLTAVLQDILTAHRLGSVPMRLLLQDIRLGDAVTGAISSLSGEAKQQTRVLVPNSDDTLVRADPQRLSLIISCLLQNALNHSARDAKVRLRSFASNATIEIHIEDEGIGIPADQLEQVFDGFVRPQTLAQWQSGAIGIGLCLYVSRNLARRMGGDLRAEQRETIGTRMVLSLPRAQARNALEACSNEAKQNGAPSWNRTSATGSGGRCSIR